MKTNGRTPPITPCVSRCDRILRLFIFAARESSEVLDLFSLNGTRSPQFATRFSTGRNEQWTRYP